MEILSTSIIVSEGIHNGVVVNIAKASNVIRSCIGAAEKKAKINLSNQCGTNQMMVRYSKCYESQRQFPLAHNFVEGEIYL